MMPFICSHTARGGEGEEGPFTASYETYSEVDIRHESAIP
jgi:hypothetical protein